MSMEELKHFKKVDNIAEYVKEGIKSGRLTVDEVAKFARIHARQGNVGQVVDTILDQTTNIVKLDEKTGEPGWIVTNPGGEEYIVDDSTFKKKYEIDPENPSQYKPKGGPVLSTPLNENVEFVAPWGETMQVPVGGSLILSGPTDIYGVHPKAMEETYKSTGKDKRECLKEAIALMGITKEEFMAAREAAQQEASSRDVRDDKVVDNDEQELE